MEKVKDAITSPVAFKALSGSTMSIPLMLCHSCYSLPTSRALPPLPPDLATSGLPPSSPFFFFFLFVVEKVRTGETRVLVYLLKMKDLQDVFSQTMVLIPCL